jgi:hypothetical protein
VIKKSLIIPFLITLIFSTFSPIAIYSANAATVGTGPCISTVSSATGVTATVSGNYCVVSFTDTVTATTWTVPSGVTSIEYLVVGGGGGGGGGYEGGGGGAGGFLTGTTSVTPSSNYQIYIGGGGLGTLSSRTAANGDTSTAFSFSAIGGGRGSSSTYVASATCLPSAPYCNAAKGGSGGGTGHPSYGPAVAGTSGQGNSGGYDTRESRVNTGNSSPFAAAGGGGAGGAGGNTSGTTGGAGGRGSASSITGSATCYAAGGAGGKRDPSTAVIGGSCSGGGVVAGGSGGANAAGGNGSGSTGGGGGGSGGGGGGGAGGNGGSGIVVVKYLQPITITITTITNKLSPRGSTTASATVSSGSLSYSASGACSVNSSTGAVTFTSTGNCTITATAASSPNPTASTTFEIVPNLTQRIISRTGVQPNSLSSFIPPPYLTTVRAENVYACLEIVGSTGATVLTSTNLNISLFILSSATMSTADAGKSYTITGTLPQVQAAISTLKINSTSGRIMAANSGSIYLRVRANLIADATTDTQCLDLGNDGRIQLYQYTSDQIRRKNVPQKSGSTP